MDSNYLKVALKQTLENYQRCGLTQFQGQELPSELRVRMENAVALMARNSSLAGDSGLAGDSVGSSSSLPAQPQTPALQAAAQPSASAEEVPQSSSSAGESDSVVDTGEWTLPVLADSERDSELASLAEQVRDCRHCTKIVSFRQQTVFGSGPVRPRVVFMGEAPGADEDRQGVPFVGKAGQLLSRIIAAMKLERDEVYILNALKCRPPQNRTPVPDEIESCRGYVHHQLELLQPEYIVCLGSVAVRSLLDNSTSIGRLRGRMHAFRGAKVVVTYHPSYLLRNESAKRLVWDDMQMLMAELGIAL